MGNGEVNQALEVYLRFYINLPTRWLESMVRSSGIRAKFHFHEAVQDTPFNLMQGLTPWAGREGGKFRKESRSKWMEIWIGKDEKTRTRSVRESEESMKKIMIEKGNRNEFEEEIQVWLDGRNLRLIAGQKLDHKKLGPSLIWRKLGKAHIDKIPKSWNRVHPVFNEVLLQNMSTQLSLTSIPEPPRP